MIIPGMIVYNVQFVDSVESFLTIPCFHSQVAPKVNNFFPEDPRKMRAEHDAATGTNDGITPAKVWYVNRQFRLST